MNRWRISRSNHVYLTWKLAMFTKSTIRISTGARFVAQFFCPPTLAYNHKHTPEVMFVELGQLVIVIYANPYRLTISPLPGREREKSIIDLQFGLSHTHTHLGLFHK